MSRRIAPFAILLAVITVGAASSPAQRVATGPLVVHEWGTFTSIAGQQGKAVEWQPLDGPQDLPCFVERHRLCVKCALAATVRMETPVIYFYAPQETTVSVDVKFHQGLVTEWYPSAAIAPTTVPTGFASFKNPDFTSTARWPKVRVMPGAPDAFPVEAGESHYYLARRTDASPIQVGNQQEKFLFYRGVGNFQPPISATIAASGRITVKAPSGGPIGDVILFENRDGTMAYEVRHATGSEATFEPLLLQGEFVAPTAELEQILVAHGLYPKEAKAMVDTWRDAWFEEGTRLFYIAPKQAIDDRLPLKVSPAPSEVVRTFVGRLEIVTATSEQEVGAAMAARDLKTLAKYGRFVRPIAERVLARDPSLDAKRLETLMQPVFQVMFPATAPRCQQ
jgi:hypothetical protein